MYLKIVGVKTEDEELCGSVTALSNSSMCVHSHLYGISLSVTEMVFKLLY